MENIDAEKTKIWFLCVPIHNNLGDYAQYICIKKWLKDTYHMMEIEEIPSAPLGYDYCGIMQFLKKKINKDDLIVFQSGYTSTDLHDDERVHRKIVRQFPENKIVFFPQTVRYSSKREAFKTAEIYNAHNQILFMARDRVSYRIAKKYFRNASVKLMPDIAAALIGTKQYTTDRKGILFCIRHDDEKKYDDKHIKRVFSPISNKNDHWIDIVLKAGEYCSDTALEKKLIQFAKHKLVVTDRFHGTIFSLITSTPVIVLKTADYKVSEGADWFVNVFPQYVRKADSIEEAYLIAKAMLKNSYTSMEEAYYKINYYDSLAEDIKQLWIRRFALLKLQY